MVRRAVITNCKLLEVWRDEMVQLVARGAHDFLALGRPEEQPNGYRINPLVVAESILMFAMFVHRVCGHVDPRPTRMTYRLHLRNALDDQGRLSRVVSHALGTMRWMMQEARVAPRADHTVQVEVAGDHPPEATGYELLREFYAWFGVEADAIPYTREEAGRRSISAEAIRNSRE